MTLFKPNAEPTWAKIRLNVGNFLGGCSAAAPSREGSCARPGA